MQIFLSKNFSLALNLTNDVSVSHYVYGTAGTLQAPCGGMEIGLIADFCCFINECDTRSLIRPYNFV
jgi:hypothetical protein